MHGVHRRWTHVQGNFNNIREPLKTGVKSKNGQGVPDSRKADEVRLYALRGGLTTKMARTAHFRSHEVFRGDHNKKCSYFLLYHKFRALATCCGEKSAVSGKFIYVYPDNCRPRENDMNILRSPLKKSAFVQKYHWHIGYFIINCYLVCALPKKRVFSQKKGR